MRNLPILLLILLVAACGKDETAVNNEPDVGRDGNALNNVNNGTPDMKTPDSANGSTDATRDTATDAELDVFMFPDVMPQVCTHPTNDPNCPMGEFGPATFLDSVEVVLDNTCCRDMTGDGVIDNKMGQILAGVVAIVGDINLDIANSIQSGNLIYLVEFANWENESFDGSFDSTIYRGTDTDLDFADNLAGTGAFEILPDSFDLNSGDPLFPFASSSVNNGALTASNGMIDLRFPGLLPQVKIITTDLVFTGDVDAASVLETGGRVTITNGTLSGAMLRDEFFFSLNEAAASCTCIGREIFVPNANGTFACDLTLAEENACVVDLEPGCRLMGDQGTCSLWGQLGDDVDIDTDGDDVNDAFSIGMRVTGVGASITGRAP